MRPLVVATWVLLALLAAHDLTHLLDDGLDTSAGQLALVAIPQWIATAVVMAVVLRGDARRSTSAALLLGAAAAIGLAVVHLLPFGVAPYEDLDPSAVSWVLAWAPTAVALLVAALAIQELRRGANARAV